MLLAIDTSNDYAGVALWDEAGLRGEATWAAGRQHTEQVLPQIDLLLRHAGGSPRGLSVVAVATGPGSWTGLRAGMSLGKALAIGSNLPVIGIASLDAAASGCRDVGRPVLALVRLGRDRFGAASYRAGSTGWERHGDFEMLTTDQVMERARKRLVVGDLPPGLDLAQAQSIGAALADPTENQRRAPYVAQLAWTRHLRREYDNLVGLEPIYLGSPVRR